MNKTSLRTDEVNRTSVSVLRLGHRLVRDTRMSTHSGLVARAFGASEIVMTGADEDETIRSIEKVNSRWGGDFRASYSKSWKEVVKNWRGTIVHLTMYGENLDKAIPRIKNHIESSKDNNLLLIIGAEKVPAEIYSLSNFNVSVGSQPHSEVAALAIFLDRFFRGKELYSTFSGAKIRIKPSGREKKIEFIN